MSSNVTPPPATPAQGSGISAEQAQELLAELDGKPSVAKVRDVVAKLLAALAV